jgi:hypothetical protein
LFLNCRALMISSCWGCGITIVEALGSDTKLQRSVLVVFGSNTAWRYILDRFQFVCEKVDEKVPWSNFARFSCSRGSRCDSF